jgi:hypothetical protein
LEKVHTGCSAHDHPFNAVVSEVECACLAMSALEAFSN